jgi:crotonobetainyl-CoA:carnitine CoA-transferase CaiB-like acyl-CoA transferase
MYNLLQGVRVLDLCRLIPGAVTTQILADLGADVIKIENPRYPDQIRAVPPFLSDGTSLTHVLTGRNKRSLALDLKTAAGKSIFNRLVDGADVVVEVSSPGAMKRNGTDYQSLRELKPDLVYCSISGFGQNGPYRMFPSHGMNYTAAAGALRVIQDERGLPRLDDRVFGGDIGALGVSSAAAMAILASLVGRSRTGHGEYIDASCWDAAAQGPLSANALQHIPQLDIPTLGARYAPYETKDGKFIFCCPLERHFWEGFCACLGKPEWKERGEWKNQLDFGAGDIDLAEGINAVMKTRTLDEWMDVFLSADVPATPVIAADEMEMNPHSVDRQMVVETPVPGCAPIKSARPPFRISSGTFHVQRSAPAPGQHSDEILEHLGCSPGYIRELRTSGVI